MLYSYVINCEMLLTVFHVSVIDEKYTNSIKMSLVVFNTVLLTWKPILQKKSEQIKEKKKDKVHDQCCFPFLATSYWRSREKIANRAHSILN